MKVITYCYRTPFLYWSLIPKIFQTLDPLRLICEWSVDCCYNSSSPWTNCLTFLDEGNYILLPNSVSLLESDSRVDQTLDPLRLICEWSPDCCFTSSSPWTSCLTFLDEGNYILLLNPISLLIPKVCQTLDPLRLICGWSPDCCFTSFSPWTNCTAMGNTDRRRNVYPTSYFWLFSEQKKWLIYWRINSPLNSANCCKTVSFCQTRTPDIAYTHPSKNLLHEKV